MENNRPDIDTYFLQMALLVSSRTTCLRRKVGCVLVDRNNHVLATGYNGPPKGLDHCNKQPCERVLQGNDYCRAVHAEQNALLQCFDINSIQRAYITHSPCTVCTRLLLNTNCKEIIFIHDYDSQNDMPKQWWLSGKWGNVWTQKKIEDNNGTILLS